MSQCSKDEVDRIAATDDLHISPFRDDGKTYGTPTWIWSVVVDGELTCAPTTGRTLAGTRLRCGRRLAGSQRRA